MSKKYNYYIVLQQNFGYGWDDICFYPDTYEGFKDMKQNWKEYKENQPGIPLRKIHRRELVKVQ